MLKHRAAKPSNKEVCGRGKREINSTSIILPGKALKQDTRYQRDKKRKRCRRRAAIEPIIGHLKSDFRLARNYLKGAIGDRINLNDGRLRMESETMAVGHFLAVFPVEKNTNYPNLLMKASIRQSYFP